MAAPAGPPAIAPVHEQPTALLRRLRLFAGVALAFGVIQVVTGHVGVLSVAGIVLAALALRAAKKPNTTHLRAFACWNSCMAGFAVAGAIVALLIATPLLSCACDAGCVDAAYDVIQDGRSWVLNNTVNGTFLPAHAANSTSHGAAAATFPTGVFFPGNTAAPAPADEDEGEEQDGRRRRLFAAVSHLREPAAAKDALPAAESEELAAVEAPAPAPVHGACPHAGHFGKLGSIIGGWLHRHGFGGRHGHGHKHGHGKWAARAGHRRPAPPADEGRDAGAATGPGYNTGIVPPPFGDPVPMPAVMVDPMPPRFQPQPQGERGDGVRVLRNDRPELPPMVAVPADQAPQDGGDVHILPFPMPGDGEEAVPLPLPMPADEDEGVEVEVEVERTPWGRVHRHFSPRRHAGLRMRHVLKSLLHALFEPLVEASEGPRDEHDRPQPRSWRHRDHEEREPVEARPDGEPDSTTTAVALPARGGVRRLIAMRRLLSADRAADAQVDSHRNKHYPPSSGGGGDGEAQPGAPGNYEVMLEERRRSHKYRTRTAAKDVENDWDGDGRSDWDGAAEGIDDDGQRALVWFLDWSGALTRPQLHMAAARLCTAGPWLMTVALCLFAGIAGFHAAAASVARKLRVHPWYVAADARRREDCAARRAARRGGSGGGGTGVELTHLPPAAVGGGVTVAPAAATAPGVDTNVTYRYVPGQGFVANVAAPAGPSAPARAWSALTGLWRSHAGYERVPVAAAADPEAAGAAPYGMELPRAPTGFAVATGSGPRYGGAAAPAPDVDPKAPIAYGAPPAGLYPHHPATMTAVPVATGVPMGAVATGMGQGWVVAAPVAVAGAPSHPAAYTYAAMPVRQ